MINMACAYQQFVRTCSKCLFLYSSFILVCLRTRCQSNGNRESNIWYIDMSVLTLYRFCQKHLLLGEHVTCRIIHLSSQMHGLIRCCIFFINKYYFFTLLNEEVLSQDSIVFYLMAKSRSNMFLEPTSTKQ